MWLDLEMFWCSRGFVVNLVKVFGCELLSLGQIMSILVDYFWILLQGSSDQISNRQHKFASHVKNRHAGSLKHNGVVSRKDSMNNGIISALDSDAIQNEMEPNHSDFQGKDKVLWPWVSIYA